MNISCTENLIAQPTFNDFGYSVVNGSIIPIWDTDEHIQNVEDKRKSYLKGCGCRTKCTSNRCGCKKAGNVCSPGCTCTGCENVIECDKLGEEENQQQQQPDSVIEIEENIEEEFNVAECDVVETDV
jgi:hypothetical protein